MFKEIFLISHTHQQGDMHPNMDVGFSTPFLSIFLSQAAASNVEPAFDKNAIHTTMFQVDPFPKKDKNKKVSESEA